ncbi:FHA domain protein [Ruegeria denitrificans]|uniref:FHA domain protein n=1 Tax=Ruegeria denitrificans TaxID=1715692 RepID=A0A0N7M9H3_9RHOB|nr:FHA domain-containing protein [Ruegeria denitrificans]CUJ99404.1 FHA domain protein [Ruegeria denitrificans]
MFKYKSPLSRLLEGAGKSKETEAETEVEIKEVAAPEAEKPQPIADFNALRNALAGGNISSETYEDTDELIPEKDMPEFSEEQDETAEEDIAVPEVVEETQDNIFETPEEHSKIEEPVVTLHIATEEEIAAEEAVQAEAPQEESIIEVVVETLETAQPEAEEPAQPEPVAEITPEPEVSAEPVQPVPTPTPEDRRGRVKTTFLGFERADTHVQDMIESADPIAKTETAQETFPVGWLVVTTGPGRGSCITLTEGLMQIGRNDDQAIQLDFGDTGISRSNHAVIAYDPEDRKCYLGHGGKANLVRLNGKPVLSTVALSSGDLIRISETSIRFAAFCDDGFDWRDA